MQIDRFVPDDPLLPYPTHLSAAAGGALLGAAGGIDTAAAVIGAIWLMIIIGTAAYRHEEAKGSGEVKIDAE